MTTLPVRDCRTFENYSRGMELARAIRSMWAENREIPQSDDRNRQVNANIQAIRDEFDLTLAEWHYWAQQARYVR